MTSSSSTTITTQPAGGAVVSCPYAPPGFFRDPTSLRTLSPRVAVTWRDGDFRLVALENVVAGEVLWDEAAVLVFARDPECPLNYGAARPVVVSTATTGGGEGPVVQSSSSSSSCFAAKDGGALPADQANLMKRLRHVPQLMRHVPRMKDIVNDNPQCLSLQMAFLAHAFSTSTSTSDVWAWLGWCPWGDIFRHMYPHSEEDAKTATTASAAVLQALPQNLRSDVAIVDLVRLWFIATRGAVPVNGAVPHMADGDDSPILAVYHFLSVARRMRCADVVNCDVRVQSVSDLQTQRVRDSAPSDLHVRAVATKPIARGTEVCVGMHPVNLGPLPEDLASGVEGLLYTQQQQQHNNNNNSNNSSISTTNRSTNKMTHSSNTTTTQQRATTTTTRDTKASVDALQGMLRMAMAKQQQQQQKK
eukprot:PhM_4_TR3791/c0_g1_i1/m.25753